MRQLLPCRKQSGNETGRNPVLILQVMLGGQWFEQLFGDPYTVTDDVITQAALEDLESHLGITQQPSCIITRVLKVGSVF